MFLRVSFTPKSSDKFWGRYVPSIKDYLIRSSVLIYGFIESKVTLEVIAIAFLIQGSFAQNSKSTKNSTLISNLLKLPCPQITFLNITEDEWNVVLNLTSPSDHDGILINLETLFTVFSSSNIRSIENCIILF